MSDNQVALFINLVVKALGIKDKNKYISASRVGRLRKKLGHLAIKEESQNGVIGIKFDGKTCDMAQPKSREVRTHIITCISEPGGKFMDAFESRENGLSIASGVWKTIQDSNSEESLLALGCGK